MSYEQLLSQAYKEIKPIKEGERFEIKKAEGHLQGGKTIISNFVQIASCLRREPGHLAKFLFKELAAPGQIAGERLILTRRISSQIINEKIKKYVKGFVMCPNCKKPDTELIEEKGQKFIKCLACGTKKPVANKI